MATRDIFATSRFLGHSSVIVTEQHYAGLIQSLQVEYSRKFEDALNSRMIAGDYLVTILRQNQTNTDQPTKKKKSSALVEKTEDSDGGRCRIRTYDPRLVRAML